MAEYWKSTPNYWCKFCSQYVRDTPFERKNHETSGKHQNNIQRSLRNLHKDKEREARDQQRAKDEVARLNGLVGGKKASSVSPGPQIKGLKDVTPSASAGRQLSESERAAQRKAHAEQLLALGVQLPEELKREVQGVGGWQTVSQTVVEDEVKPERSLADIMKWEQDAEAESKLGIKVEEGQSRGVRKRKMEDEEDVRDEEAAPKERKLWGSSMRRYPGAEVEEEGDGEDLDALLSGVKRKKQDETALKAERGLKKEESNGEKPLDTIPEIDAPLAAIKQEDEGGEDTAAPVVFKKRKGKK
ncbi:uncharacterized protein LTR77_006992 [Saxophila tyrrhenica]|uniref:Matrin-type domain-containing protein n=1 Tax=Saxophila tyrrhenica TaxID=1690608 RepID=A0AAV9P6J9_9PEZI|nr:hypothetical protein LTR77_006992 [Saxophila tyrrhenica]